MRSGIGMPRMPNAIAPVMGAAGGGVARLGGFPGGFPMGGFPGFPMGPFPGGFPGGFPSSPMGPFPGSPMGGFPRSPFI